MKITTPSIATGPTAPAGPAILAPAPVVLLDRAVNAWHDARTRGDPPRELALVHLELSAARMEAEAPAQPVRRMVHFPSGKLGGYEKPKKIGRPPKKTTAKKPKRVIRDSFRSEVTPERLDAMVLRYITEKKRATIPALKLHIVPIRASLLGACIDRLMKAKKIERIRTRVSCGSMETYRTELAAVRRK